MESAERSIQIPELQAVQLLTSPGSGPAETFAPDSQELRRSWPVNRKGLLLGAPLPTWKRPRCDGSFAKRGGPTLASVARLGTQAQHQIEMRWRQLVQPQSTIASERSPLSPGTCKAAARKGSGKSETKWKQGAPKEGCTCKAAGLAGWFGTALCPCPQHARDAVPARLSRARDKMPLCRLCPLDSLDFTRLSQRFLRSLKSSLASC